VAVVLPEWLSVRPAGGVVEVGTASRPDSFQRARSAGAVKDAEGTAERREPQATVLDGPEHRGI
jgi:hypothetical protein